MLTVIDHPLVQHKLTMLRMKETTTGGFRRLAREISLLLGYEVLRDLPLEPVTIETPMEEMQAMQVQGKKLCFVSILRAGAGILEGMLDLVPAARVAHVGMYRDHETHEPVEYYFKAPEALEERLCVVVDPMLATGHSAAAAVTRLKQAGAQQLKFVCLLAAPEGVKAFEAAHPDVPIYTASLDRQLDENAYILPGLGDAGDRLFGTK
ncbi:uracil phosphoribosyltransferase [Acidocella aminolytica]|jgi:uracil phosphoribosyltransferase|uniref:Uracil phosphoribosyltransferase n=1 Tax=Acidocella aminolytica 101 = DSM 11237 TaxID=1120923 RepID=A0A0D6PF39_9PROT|nr:uracil phosphoribosyltransferase [Acidocella aminolytica]GAN79976.1 uracil phosphoribosyltransferase [Acidocella aminolytica 101 = DSM 11237]GBQ41285.1 uracil phosphoribosyltransferase [Acidocella aminolytica 101 = DSM 11237]SHE57870.1 uracil phosphoribosyltransferase [Acidocella aminolytica 101 = DSM 11237]